MLEYQARSRVPNVAARHSGNTVCCWFKFGRTLWPFLYSIPKLSMPDKILPIFTNLDWQLIEMYVKSIVELG
jgi:hypothetical protein